MRSAKMPNAYNVSVWNSVIYRSFLLPNSVKGKHPMFVPHRSLGSLPSLEIPDMIECDQTPLLGTKDVDFKKDFSLF